MSDRSCCIAETLLTSELSLVITLGEGDVPRSLLARCGRLKGTYLKYLEDFFCRFVFNAGASSFLLPPLAAHSFWKFCFLALIPLIELEGPTELS